MTLKHNFYFDSNQIFKINTTKATVIDKQDALVSPDELIINKGGYIIFHD